MASSTKVMPGVHCQISGNDATVEVNLRCLYPRLRVFLPVVVIGRKGLSVPLPVSLGVLVWGHCAAPHCIGTRVIRANDGLSSQRSSPSLDATNTDFAGGK